MKIIFRIKKPIMALVFLTLGFNSVSGQSKKEIIQYLQFKIDSMNSAFAELTQNQNLRIKSFEDQIALLQKNNANLKFNIDSLKSAFNEHLQKQKALIKSFEDQISLFQKNYSDLLIAYKILKDSLGLYMYQAKPKTFHDIEYCVSSNYAQEKIEKTSSAFSKESDQNMSRFNFNSAAIIDKEKHRVLNSEYAIRDHNFLYLNAKNKKLFLKNDTFNFGSMQKFYSFLFEDLKNEKVYCAEIVLCYAGGGTEQFSLIEVDLKSGKIYSLAGDSDDNTNSFQGGGFYFNSDNSFVVVGGWNCSGGPPFPCNSDLKIVNLGKRKIELKIVDSEIMNLEWLSDTSFKCQVIKYSQLMEPYAYFNRPMNYLIPFTLFTFKNGKWISTKL